MRSLTMYWDLGILSVLPHGRFSLKHSSAPSRLGHPEACPLPKVVRKCIDTIHHDNPSDFSLLTFVL